MSSVQRQPESKLSSHLEMGAVELAVQDLDKQRHFYQELVGLSVLREDENQITLGHEGRPIIKLLSDPELGFPPAGSAGLYHTATVFDNRMALARALLRILTDSPQLYSGSADHLVSEAFYFDDPEGNGVELYYDKDPNTWRWQNGQVEMASIYIDIKDYIDRYALSATTSDSAANDKKMGHVHLKVGSIAEAKHFYIDILGFRSTIELPTALFVSDGQYHHHLGMNTWESSGAGQRFTTLGLKSLSILLEKGTDLVVLEERLIQSKLDFTKSPGKITVHDPWLNQLIFLG